MSTLIVDVCEVAERKPHPNADKVEMVRVKNWWVVSKIGQFKEGDKCVFFPPDSVISETLADKFGVTKYLAPVTKDSVGKILFLRRMRIKAARFRGERSFGFIAAPEDPTWPVGMSVIDHYGVTKYEPPMRCVDGDVATPIAAFHAYTDIENIGNFPGILEDGEEVVIEEKIHGSNIRVGKILMSNPETGEAEYAYVCGSRTQRRKEIDNNGVRSKFWQGLTPEIKNLLDHLCGDKRNVIVFGELYGAGIQDMQYGLTGQAVRVFDISIDHKYIDHDERYGVCEMFDVETAPFLYRGPFSMAKVQELTDGQTLLCDPSKAGAFKGRKGVVIRPIKDRHSKNLPNYGRVLLKSVSVDYLERKNGTEFH
jgi:RNA ligase (TIGR02306 family)